MRIKASDLIKRYYKPTPKKWRKIGDALLGVSYFASASEIVQSNHALAISILVIGIIGKFLTNLFAEDEKSHAQDH